ncbi:MAG: fasciclin domain-containing protein [Cellulosilyticum sp.]|nr:fasciclin domain-containing protein [Cellulosilyticum sp.]MEE1073404.1 fasciclin domain-containing protein [Cellulosilyticum sp.]
MKHRSKLLLVSVLLVAMLVQTSMCIVAKPRNEQEMNIVEIAQQNKDLTTLVKALDSAGLVDTLKGDGPFTVFAPTDHAFKNLPNGTLEDLLKPENKNKLTDVLTYHVKQGKVSSEEALKLNGQDIMMLNGKPAKIEVKDGSLYIDGAKVIVADVQAKNGVIHIIDAVMLP